MELPENSLSIGRGSVKHINKQTNKHKQAKQLEDHK